MRGNGTGRERNYAMRLSIQRNEGLDIEAIAMDMDIAKRVMRCATLCPDALSVKRVRATAHSRYGSEYFQMPRPCVAAMR